MNQNIMTIHEAYKNKKIRIRKLIVIELLKSTSMLGLYVDYLVKTLHVKVRDVLDGKMTFGTLSRHVECRRNGLG